jgi:hypothetical protein
MTVRSDASAGLQWHVRFGGHTSTTTARVLDPLYALEAGSAGQVLDGLDLTAVPEGKCIERPAVD